MIYALGALALYLLVILWIGYIGPAIDRDIAELKRRDKARADEWCRRQEEAIREEQRRQEERARKLDSIGPFLKFAFPLIKRASPALVAPQLVSVQPMTVPVGGIAFYRSQYGEQEELRTVLDDMVDALNEDDELDRMDPARRCARVAEQIVWEVFHDHPYSTHYGKPRPSVAPPSIKGPPVREPETHTDLAHRVGSLLQAHEAAASSLLGPTSAVDHYQRRWSRWLDGGPQATLLEEHLRSLFHR